MQKAHLFGTVTCQGDDLSITLNHGWTQLFMERVERANGESIGSLAELDPTEKTIEAIADDDVVETLELRLRDDLRFFALFCPTSEVERLLALAVEVAETEHRSCPHCGRPLPYDG